jgi:hypothetical protein
MTRDEVAELITQIPQNLTVNEFIVALVNKAVSIEREACAQIAEVENMTQKDIARVIRERE